MKSFDVMNKGNPHLTITMYVKKDVPPEKRREGEKK
jgi:hypothetical protein